jgi:hypothetical protein
LGYVGKCTQLFDVQCLGDAIANGNGNINSDFAAYYDTDEHGYVSADSDTDFDSNSNGDKHADQDGDGNAHPHKHKDGDAYDESYFHAYSHADATPPQEIGNTRDTV